MDYQNLLGSVAASSLRAQGINVSVPAPSKRKTPDFTSTVSGIPCGIVVDHYTCVKPSTRPAELCDSDLDYYGYTEFEFTVVDRRGYHAKWLEAKITEDDEERLCNEYKEILESNSDY